MQVSLSVDWRCSVSEGHRSRMVVTEMDGMCNYSGIYLHSDSDRLIDGCFEATRYAALEEVAKAPCFISRGELFTLTPVQLSSAVGGWKLKSDKMIGYEWNSTICHYYLIMALFEQYLKS